MVTELEDALRIPDGLLGIFLGVIVLRRTSLKAIRVARLDVIAVKANAGFDQFLVGLHLIG
jgi:hypothetical protein